ncbi:hypothetical protein [Streptomyces profundus]|uniref:hypothetical protein n=1 Tax=Streptomyces profundus TaxID=2867410 RepID=UPI001D16BD33|nr:hypothetical protein [Streptomyces sp. MA3_2.13]UED83890.1 hypothetical protein K4G22_06410 [Streptomyces sp. MA3_2.13]
MAGCSGGSDEPEPEPEPSAESSEPSPSPTPSEDLFSEEIATVENLARFCGYREGEAYDEGAEYSGDGPHTMVVNLSEERTDLPLGNSFTVQDGEPFSDWIPDEPTEAELLGCVEGVPGETEVDLCVYEEFGVFPDSSVLSLPLYGQTFHITVYELRTATVVAETILEPEPDCPANIEYFQLEDELPNLVYTPVVISDVSDYLAEVVSAPAG